MGLMQALEWKRDRGTRNPAVEETRRLMNLVRDNGFTLGKGESTET